MTTGRINQITLCRSVLRDRRAPNQEQKINSAARNGTVRFYAHREASNSASHAVFFNYPCKSFARCNIRTVARRLDSFVSRPRYHSSEVPTQYKVTRIIRRVCEHKRLRHPGKRHKVPSKPTSLAIEMFRAGHRYV